MMSTMPEESEGMRSVELSTTGRKPAFFQAASAAGSPFQVNTLPFAVNRHATSPPRARVATAQPPASKLSCDGGAGGVQSIGPRAPSSFPCASFVS